MESRIVSNVCLFGAFFFSHAKTSLATCGSQHVCTSRGWGDRGLIILSFKDDFSFFFFYKGFNNLALRKRM